MFDRRFEFEVVSGVKYANLSYGSMFQSTHMPQQKHRNTYSEKEKEKEKWLL